MDTFDIVAACAIVAIASFGHSVAGFGFSLLAVAPLGLVIDPKDAVAVSMIFLVAVSGLVAFLGRDVLDWKAARPLLEGAVPGLPLGLLALVAMSATALRAALAVAIVYSLVSLTRGFSLTTTSRTIERLAGVATGFLTTSINANGPPAVLVLQARGVEPQVFRSTVSAVLGLSSAAGVVLFTLNGRIDGEVLAATAWATPGLVVGWSSGDAVSKRVPPAAFRSIVLGLLALAAASTGFALLTGS